MDLDSWAQHYRPGSPQVSLGDVRWPGWAEETREGGTYIVAVVRAAEDEPWRISSNLDGAIALSSGDVLVDRAGHAVPTLLPDEPPVLACLLVGITNRVYRLRTAAGPGAGPRYWRCSEGDLAPRGRGLVAVLASLYHREVTLLTFLDTYTDLDGPTS